MNKGNRNSKLGNDVSKLELIFESRLSLQSIQRYLSGHGLPHKIEFFRSNEFIRNHYSKWSQFQIKSFLIKMVGPFNWKKMQEVLEQRKNQLI